MSDIDKRLEELVRLATKPRQGDGVTMACDELCSVSIPLASSLLRARKALREVSEQSIPEAPRAKARAFEIVRSTMDRVDAALADPELEESLL